MQSWHSDLLRDVNQGLPLLYNAHPGDAAAAAAQLLLLLEGLCVVAKAHAAALQVLVPRHCHDWHQTPQSFGLGANKPGKKSVQRDGGAAAEGEGGG
jgi:hypothetical protein